MYSLQGSESTKYQGELRLRKCEWLGETPDKLIAERKEDMKSEDPKVRHRAEMYVKRFLKTLADEGVAPNTRRTYFYRHKEFLQEKLSGTNFLSRRRT